MSEVPLKLWYEEAAFVESTVLTLCCRGARRGVLRSRDVVECRNVSEKNKARCL